MYLHESLQIVLAILAESDGLVFILLNGGHYDLIVEDDVFDPTISELLLYPLDAELGVFLEDLRDNCQVVGAHEVAEKKDRIHGNIADLLTE